jgi:hypothetical protein
MYTCVSLNLNLTEPICADAPASETRIEALELEKSKLQVEVATLQSKLEMQQHHSGGLGAAMLQERLEAQQRRIAALELAKKVSVVQSSWCVTQTTHTLTSFMPSLHELHKMNMQWEDYMGGGLTLH